MLEKKSSSGFKTVTLWYTKFQGFVQTTVDLNIDFYIHKYKWDRNVRGSKFCIWIHQRVLIVQSLLQTCQKASTLYRSTILLYLDTNISQIYNTYIQRYVKHLNFLQLRMFFLRFRLIWDHALLFTMSRFCKTNKIYI